MATQRVCSVNGCDKPHIARGFCTRHYARAKKHGDPLAGPVFHGEPKRFLTEVAIPFVGDECLAWPFATMLGYGVMWHGGGKRLVHQLVCEAVHGKKPSPTHEVAHGCGKGHEGCVNPKHLRWDTRPGNQADRVVHGTDNRGRRNALVKLTEKQVVEIRDLLGTDSYSGIGRRYSVSAKAISMIANGQSWTWLT